MVIDEESLEQKEVEWEYLQIQHVRRDNLDNSGEKREIIAAVCQPARMGLNNVLDVNSDAFQKVLVIKHIEPKTLLDMWWSQAVKSAENARHKKSDVSIYVAWCERTQRIIHCPEGRYPVGCSSDEDVAEILLRSRYKEVKIKGYYG